MDNHRRRPKQPRTSDRDSQEVSSKEWEFINLSEQEEDLLYRMYRLVGDSFSREVWRRLGIASHIAADLPKIMNDIWCRWTLIAGRIPGRKPEEIERFWIMKHAEGFAEKRLRRAG